MRRSTRPLLRLSKRNFDVVWSVMIAAGAGSLVAHSYPVAAVPWLASSLLVVALVIGVSLTLFVERAAQKPDNADLAIKVLNTEAEDVMVVQEKGQGWSHGQLKAINFWRIQPPRSSHSVQFWCLDTDGGHDESRMGTSASTRDMFEQLLVRDSESARARDIVKEAVQIARHLQGTSLEVRLCRDGDIVISDSTQPKDGDDANVPFKNEAFTSAATLLN